MDSLSDAVVFGIVPALTLFLWALQDLGNIALGDSHYFMLFVLFCGLLDLTLNCLTKTRNIQRVFFVGIPAPAAAFLVLLPVVLLEVTDQSWLRNEQLVSVILVSVGAGAVSTMPTFNGKSFQVPSHAILPFLAVIDIGRWNYCYFALGCLSGSGWTLSCQLSFFGSGLLPPSPSF